MTAEELAETHAAAFPGKGWGAGTFGSYLVDPNATVHGDATCFAVIRRVGEEAEILTVATHPDRQGEGLATAMLARALDEQAAAGAREVILDVAEDNAPARALYARLGFAEVATRKDYYRTADGTRVTARILRKSL